MNKHDLIEAHHDANKAFTEYIGGLPEVCYNYSHENIKWDAGQQLDHILKSVRAFRGAVSKPKFALILKFGKANRPSRSMDEMIAKYHAVLEGGFQAVAPFLPDHVAFSDRQECMDKIMTASSDVEKRIAKYSERALDTVIIPHPALGKLTMRELMYFATHHANHHREITRKYVNLYLSQS